MADKGTPEEKLLKLIENPVFDKAAKPLTKKRPAFRFSLANFRLSKKYTDAFTAKLKFYLFNLKFINKGLVTLSILLTIYLVADFIRNIPNINRLYASDTSAPRKILASAQGVTLKLEEYIGEFAKRDMFHFIPVKKEEKALEGKELLAEVSKNLKLVGIIWSKKPQVMIEVKKENKTLLLNEGDAIDNITVKQILRDKVILSLEGNEIELM